VPVGAAPRPPQRATAAARPSPCAQRYPRRSPRATEPALTKAALPLPPPGRPQARAPAPRPGMTPQQSEPLLEQKRGARSAPLIWRAPGLGRLGRVPHTCRRTGFQVPAPHRNSRSVPVQGPGMAWAPARPMRHRSLGAAQSESARPLWIPGALPACGRPRELRPRAPTLPRRWRRSSPAPRVPSYPPCLESGSRARRRSWCRRALQPGSALHRQDRAWTESPKRQRCERESRSEAGMEPAAAPASDCHTHHRRQHLRAAVLRSSHKSAC
jgi:hypothetical protein